MSGPRVSKGMLALFLFAGAVAVGIFVKRTLGAPDGGWDAWMIWNLRARWLLHAPSFAEAFPAALPVTHPDYPILLPTLVALGWWVAGHESAAVPVAWAAVFALLYVGLTVLALARQRGWAWGLTAGTLLLSAPMFVWCSADQCADIPLGVFLLAGAVAVIEASGEEGRRRAWLHMGAGLALSLAALTKNEGLVYLITGLAAVLLIGKGQRWRDALWLSLGALPGLMLLGWFKLRYAPPGEYGGSAALAMLVDPARWLLVSVHVLRRFVYFQGWTLLLVLVPAGFWFGLRNQAQPGVRRVALGMLGALGLLAASYLVTPYDAVWQIDNSFDRILLQCLATLLLILFVSVPGGARLGRAPESVVHSSPS